jgi:hypothetical protein
MGKRPYQLGTAFIFRSLQPLEKNTARNDGRDGLMIGALL